MAKNIKDKQAEYDKCMAQAQQYKFQCPSKCLAHSLLHRLLKKLGEHHILALLVEPKILEEPDVRVEKIIEAQNSHKSIAAQQAQKRPLNVQNGHYSNNATKKPRNGYVNGNNGGGYQQQQQPPRTFNSSSNGYLIANRSFNNAAISALQARPSKSFSPASSLPSLRNVTPYRPSQAMPQSTSSTVKSVIVPPVIAASSTAKNISTPYLVSQVPEESVKQSGDCHLKLRFTGSGPFFSKADAPTTTLPPLPPRKYETSQLETGVSKIIFNTEKNGSDYKLCITIFRFGDRKKFRYFGMAFRDPFDAKWRCTSENELPNESPMVTVVIPLSNVTSRLAVFSIWFGKDSNPNIIKNPTPEVMCAPIMVDLYSDTRKKYIATFEPEFVEIIDDD